MCTGLPSSNRNAAHARWIPQEAIAALTDVIPTPWAPLTTTRADRKKLVRAIVDTTI